MAEEWQSGRIINPDQVRQFVENASGASDTIRVASQFLDMLADYAGPALDAIALISNTSPVVGFLNSLAALIQSLITDLLNQGVYTIYHHNIQDAINQIGIYNAISPEARENLPPVAVNLEAVEGANPEMMRDTQVEGSGTLNFTEIDFDGQEWDEIRGFQHWIRGILWAFDDKFDSRRPLLDESGGIGGVVFLVGAEYLLELQPLIEALGKVLEISLFEELASGLDNWEAIDLDNASRLGEAAMFRTVRDTVYSRSGEAPDFNSVKVKDLFPDFGTVVVNFDALLDLLKSVDLIGEQVSDLVRAIELKLRQLSKVFEELADLLDRIARLLVELPAVYSLWLPVEVGGVPHLQNRIWESEDRPPYGPGAFLVGGGFFVTTPGAYNLLKSLLFPEEGDVSDSPLVTFSPSPGLEGVGAPEFVISPEDWASWLGGTGREEIFLDPSMSGVFNRTGTDNAGSRGVPNYGNDGFVEDGGGSGNVEGSSGGSRRSGRRTDSEAPGDDSGLGSQVGGMLIQRDSWGTYQSELHSLAMGHDPSGGRAVMSNIGSKSYYLAHVAHDTPRLESIYEINVPVLPSGLLIEGEKTNRFLHSDRFVSATLHGGAASSLLQNAAPSADLMRRLKEAGPALVLEAPVGTGSVIASGLRGTPDHSGCALTNLVNPGGSAFDVSLVSAGDWVLGRQEIDLFGEFQDAFFIVEVDSVDVPEGIIYFSPAIFTEPTARTLLISDIVIIDDSVGGYMEQGGLPFDASTYVDTFSIFARSAQWSDDYKGFAAQYLGDAKGPAYSSQLSLKMGVLHTLVSTDGPGQPFYFNNGVLTAQQVNQSIASGAIVELKANTALGEKAWHFFVLSAVETTELTLTLSPAIRGGHVYDDDSPILEARILDGTDTYQGYRRLKLEVPRRHVERTALIPDPGDPNAYLTLSHSDVSNIEGWIVTPGDVLVPVVYDPNLAGVSFRMGPPGAILAGRACVEVSPDLRTTYPGRIFQVAYDTLYTSGSIRIFPWHVLPDTGIGWSQPPGGEVRLWRAQWEAGPMSSPIPTAEASRSRAPDIVSSPGGKLSVPGSGEAVVSCTFRPYTRSALLETNDFRVLFYGTGYFVFGIRGLSSQARLRMLVGGVQYQSSGFDYEADDELELSVSFEYGSTEMRFVVVKNGGPVFDEVVSGVTIPTIDSLVVPGAKIYIGSNGVGDDSCFGRVADLTVEDNIP